MNNLQALAAITRGGRAILGWTQSELADKIDVWTASIARIELGNVNPRHETVQKILNAFQNAGVVVNQNLQTNTITFVVKDIFQKDKK